MDIYDQILCCFQYGHLYKYQREFVKRIILPVNELEKVNVLKPLDRAACSSSAPMSSALREGHKYHRQAQISV